MYILYDTENKIGIRTTSLESVQKIKEINPLIKEVMYLTGRNIGAMNWDKVIDMSSQVYIKWFKENNNPKKIINLYSSKPEGVNDARYLIGDDPTAKHITSMQLLEDFYMCISFRLESKDELEGIKTNLTFEYLNRETGNLTSYDPYFGPISTFYGCKKEEEIGVHHLLGSYSHTSWTQIGVSSTGLNKAVLENNYVRIREILKDFS